MNGEKTSDFVSRFCELLDSLPLNDTEIAQQLNVSKQTISAWRTGARSPKTPTVLHISATFGVSEAWLMGFDVPMASGHVAGFPVHPDLLPISRRSVPLLGEIACGEPIFAEQDLSTYTAVGASVDCDFALRCKGDSMIGARIYDGDVVFIKRQEFIDDGTIAAVLIDDDATLKRVYKLADGRIELRAENPSYPRIIIGGSNETRTLRILGKAVAFQSEIH